MFSLLILYSHAGWVVGFLVFLYIIHSDTLLFHNSKQPLIQTVYVCGQYDMFNRFKSYSLLVFEVYVLSVNFVLTR